MTLRNWTFGLGVLPLGWVLAAALAVPATAVAADEYADAAAANGTTEFVEEVFMPATTHGRPAAAVKVAAAEPGEGVEEFAAEVFMPASTHRTPAETEEVGAASGEPEEAIEAPTAAIPEGERAAREKWLESIWNSP